jgi:hypothetical protein
VTSDKEQGAKRLRELVQSDVASAADMYVYYVDGAGLDLTEAHKSAFERLKCAVLALRVAHSVT